MEETTEKKKIKSKKRALTFLGMILLGLTLLGIGFWVYVEDYYKAEDIALTVLATGDYEMVDNLTILHGDSGKGIIFYPGAKVEAIAYLPLLQQLQQVGFTCVLVEMPFHMAIFNVNGADKVFDLGLDVAEWYMAGHSMGGGMASSYASDHPENIEGLILLGAYVYGSYPPAKSITIYGSYNSNLEEKIGYTENIHVIDGGNHAKFGNCGIQKGDPEGDISHAEQQAIAVNLILDFVGI